MKQFNCSDEQGLMLGYNPQAVEESARAAAQAMWSQDIDPWVRIWVGCQYGAMSREATLRASAFLISLLTQVPVFPGREEILSSISTMKRVDSTTRLAYLNTHLYIRASDLQVMEDAHINSPEFDPSAEYPQGYEDLQREVGALHAICVAAALVEITHDTCNRLLYVYSNTCVAEGHKKPRCYTNGTPMAPVFAKWLKDNIKVIYEGFITEG